MMASALVAGYRDLLVGDIPIPTATDAKSLKIKDASKLTDIEARTLKNARLSEQGFAELTLAIDTETQEGKVCYSLIKKTKKGEFPNGNLAQAWANLKTKYGGMELSDLDDHNEKFQSARMRRGQDPDTFINYLERLRNKIEELDHEVDDDHFIRHILNRLTDDYETLRTIYRRDQSSGKVVSLAGLQLDLAVRFKELRRSGKGRKFGEEERALVAQFQSSKPPKKKCYKCGKFGHLAKNCTAPESDKPRAIVCYNCGVEGHKANKCPKRRHQEKAHAAIEEAEVNLMCLALAADELKSLPMEENDWELMFDPMD